MGLTVVVGILADLQGSDDEGLEHYRAQFDAVNRALDAEGLPPHREPESLKSSYSEDMVGYSALHHLRLVAAYSWRGKGLPPAGLDDPSQDPVVVEYNETMAGRKQPFHWTILGRGLPKSPRYDHLMFHSDAEGYYLPQDFAEVIFPGDDLEIAGAMIGSASQLQKECTALARLLGIPADLDGDDDDLHAAIQKPARDGPPWKAHAIATHACLKLQAACAFSLANRSAIVFA